MEKYYIKIPISKRIYFKLIEKKIIELSDIKEGNVDAILIMEINYNRK